MMLRFSLGLMPEADAVDAAIDTVIAAGQLTRDLGGQLPGSKVTEAIIAALKA